MAENDTSPDSDLQLKKRARRRLVGATALALLAVIVLPMVMDHEPRPSGQDIQVRIPAQDGGLAAKVIPGKTAPTPLPTAPAAPVAVASAAPAPAAAAVAPSPAPVPVALPAVAEPKPAAVPVPPAAPVPAAKAADKPAEKAAPKPAEKPVAKPAEKAEKAVAEKPAKADGQWVVQLGAYKESGNVKLLLAKLKEVGVPGYTEKFESPQGPRTRVRAGPFANRDAAEKAQKRIKIIGVDGPVAPK